MPKCNNKCALTIVTVGTKPMRETEPESVAALAKKTGRQRCNLSRTLKTMSRYGLVDLKRENKVVPPVVKASGFEIHASA